MNDSLLDLVLGAVFAALVVLVFFRDLRNTVVTVIGLPIIIIGTFAAMQFLGMSLNLITLLALSLAVGLVIDDAIVVRENIFRHMERGEDPKTASLNGTNEVSGSVVAMTLTVVSVFLPIAFVSGLIGRIFSQFGLTVTAAVVLSLIEAFTLAPMLAASWFKQRKEKAAQKAQNMQEAPAAAAPVKADAPEHDGEAVELEEAKAARLGWMDLIYRGALVWTLNHKLVTMGIGALFLVGIIATIPFLEFSFLPSTGSSTISLSILMPPGTPLNATDAEARKIEATLRELSDAQDVFVTVGGQGTPEKASFTVKLKEENAYNRVERELREKLVGVPGLAFSAGGIGGGGSGVTGRPIQLNLQTNGSQQDLSWYLTKSWRRFGTCRGWWPSDRALSRGNRNCTLT